MRRFLSVFPRWSPVGNRHGPNDCFDVIWFVIRPMQMRFITSA